MFITAAFPSVAAPYTAAELQGNHGFTREELIQHYFHDGYKTIEIISLLLLRHGFFISIRHLQRILRRLRLRRRDKLPLQEVVAAIQTELNGSGSMLGYRLMWRILTTKWNLCVSQHDVRQLLKVMDPVGVEARSQRRFRRRQYINKGPNYMIHVDGFDKLKPFGISVHGAIDGFSRRILWLKVGPSNKNPRYIARFYIELVQKLQGVPKIIRGDRGTENSLIRDIQIALRLQHTDTFSGEHSFLYGRSSANQRIEAWWSYLQRMCSRHWVNYLKDLRDLGIIDTSNELHIECVRFCFTGLIQRDFNRVSEMWNQHSIRYQPNTECPCGKPDLLYFTPECFLASDYRMPLHFSNIDLEDVKHNYCEQMPTFGCSTDFSDALSQLVGRLDMYTMPNSKEEAFDLLQLLLGML